MSRALSYSDIDRGSRDAIEAGANRIHVVFDRDANRERVTKIAFIDNGPGMLPEMARYALSWGGGTHFDDPKSLA